MEDNVKLFLGNLELLVQAVNYVQSNSTSEEHKVKLMLANEEVVSARLSGMVQAWNQLTQKPEEVEEND